MIAHAGEPPGDAPAGSQSPCEWLIAHRDAGTPLPRQIELARTNHALFTQADIRCLKNAEVHKRVWEAARGPSLGETIAQAREEALVGRYDVEFVSVIVGRPGPSCSWMLWE